jgi:hypothetical protein
MCAAGLAGDIIVEDRPTICTIFLQIAFSFVIPKQLLSIGSEFRRLKHVPLVKTYSHYGLHRRTTSNYHLNSTWLKSCTVCPMMLIAQTTTAAIYLKIKCFINIKVTRWGNLLLENLTAQIGPVHNIPPKVSALQHKFSAHPHVLCRSYPFYTILPKISPVQFINVCSRTVIKPNKMVCLIT